MLQTLLADVSKIYNYELKIMKIQPDHIIFSLIISHTSRYRKQNYFYLHERQASERMKSLSLVLEDENWSILACLVKCICCLPKNVRMRFTSKDPKSTQLLPNTHFCHLDFRCFCFPFSYKVLLWFC